MKYPKVTFEYNNLEKEAGYVCFLAKSIQMNFYQRGGFTVLPRKIKGNSECVYFPNLKYPKDFWSAITKSEIVNYGVYDHKLVKIVNKILPKNPEWKVENKKARKIVNEWKIIEKEFWGLCESFLDLGNIISKISKIEVLITPIGTRSSYHILKTNSGKFQIKMTLRDDFDVKNISTTLLYCLYRLTNKVKAEAGSREWFELNAIVNFLTTHTVLKNLSTNTSSINKFDKKSIEKSDEYLKSLGFPRKPILELINGKILMDSKIYLDFTKQETRVVKKLISNRNNLTSYDELADTVWGANADEKFSLSAISKIIENVRRKLESEGVRKELIITIHGQGYLLND